MLVDAEYSRRLVLLRALMEAATGRSATGLADPEPALTVLAAAQRVAPDAVRDVILHPPFGVWLGHTVALFHQPNSDAETSFDYLYLIAAAAAIRANMPCVLPIPIRCHEVVIPTVGRLRLPAELSSGVVELRHNESETSIANRRVAFADALAPVPVHVASTADIELVVAIDGIDPYREFTEPLRPRETDLHELSSWRTRLDETWEIMVRRHPGWAGEVASCLRLVTPVDPAMTGGAFSSAAAIGAIAAPVGLSPTELAETFVHEVQHSKLNAVMNLVDLVNVETTGRYYVPWREDPRPLAGTLHGIYAFVAVAEFWLAHGGTAYEFHLAYRRQQVRWALNSVVSADGLTELGAELIAGVDRRLVACERAPVSPELDTIVEQMIIDHYACWRIRNIQVDPTETAALVDAWRHDRPVDAIPPGEFTTPADVWSDRVDLLRTRVSDPGRFDRLVRDIDNPAHSAVWAADMTYAVDDYDGALARYQKLSGSLEAMVGIGLCLRAKGDHDAATPLLSRPEITAGVCAHLDRLELPADPVAVATWLAPALGETSAL